MTPPHDDYHVPEGTTAHRCPTCGRPFSHERLLQLHRGQLHPDRLDDAERAAVEAAYEDESDRLQLFRLKALIVLIVLYFGLLMTYALV